MTRIRWGLGGTLVIFSLVTAARSASAYLSRGIFSGSAAVGILAVIAIVGFVSLLLARLRVERETEGLRASPPRGALWTKRRADLEAVHAHGATFDRDATAAVTEAEERGRAYLGRYLVAVTVLVGLVGTFGGLMETLRGIAPLLTDKTASPMDVLSVPLGGLDVTFGASIVGILVTLALALVQGDLVVAEEQMLGRLEERTQHVLVPALWPANEAASERAARELLAIGERLTQMQGEAAQAFVAAEARLTAKVTQAASAELERLVERVAERLSASGIQTATALESTGRAVSDAIMNSSREQADAFAAATRLHADALAHGTKQHVDAIAQATKQQSDTIAHSTKQQSEMVAQSTKQQGDTVTQSTKQLNEMLAESTRQLSDMLTQAAKQQSETIAQSTQRQMDALSQSAERHADALLQATLTQSNALSSATQKHTDVVAHSAQLHVDAIAEASRVHAATVATHTDALSAASDQATQRADAMLQGLRSAVASSVEDATRTLSAQAVALSATVEHAHAAITEAGTQAATAMTAATTGAAEQLLATGVVLAETSAELKAGADALTPHLQALAPELGALAREVALLAARGEAVDEQAYAEELLRIGEGVERLEGLVRITQAGGAA